MPEEKTFGWLFVCFHLNKNAGNFFTVACVLVTRMHERDMHARGSSTMLYMYFYNGIIINQVVSPESYRMLLRVLCTLSCPYFRMGGWHNIYFATLRPSVGVLSHLTQKLVRWNFINIFITLSTCVHGYCSFLWNQHTKRWSVLAKI